MALSLVESCISSSDKEVVDKLGSWAAGDWLTHKFYEGNRFSEVSVDYTTEGFDKANLVRIGDLAVQAS